LESCIGGSAASWSEGQSIGNSAIQALEFRPAHLHRDIVGIDGGICDEIQFEEIFLQDRIAADRSIDDLSSHVGIVLRFIECRPTTGDSVSRRMMDWRLALHESRNYEHERKNATPDDELN
jgi:hypothetical protein